LGFLKVLKNISLIVGWPYSEETKAEVKENILKAWADSGTFSLLRSFPSNFFALPFYLPAKFRCHHRR
jgi:hypothetical protein